MPPVKNWLCRIVDSLGFGGGEGGCYFGCTCGLLSLL